MGSVTSLLTPTTPGTDGVITVLAYYALTVQVPTPNQNIYTNNPVPMLDLESN